MFGATGSYDNDKDCKDRINLLSNRKEAQTFNHHNHNM